MKEMTTDAACGRPAKRDILLIDDTLPRSSWKMTVEERDGATIIMTHSLENAISVLRIAAVDVICNYSDACTRREAEEFRAYAAKRYPDVRLVDLWTQDNGEKGKHLMPLYARDEIDCETRRSMWLVDECGDVSRKPNRSPDRECAGAGKERSLPRDGRAGTRASFDDDQNRMRASVLPDQDGFSAYREGA